MHITKIDSNHQTVFKFYALYGGAPQGVLGTYLVPTKGQYQQLQVIAEELFEPNPSLRTVAAVDATSLSLYFQGRQDHVPADIIDRDRDQLYAAWFTANDLAGFREQFEEQQRLAEVEAGDR